jgi:hypothetical protein
VIVTYLTDDYEGDFYIELENVDEGEVVSMLYDLSFADSPADVWRERGWIG